MGRAMSRHVCPCVLMFNSAHEFPTGRYGCPAASLLYNVDSPPESGCVGAAILAKHAGMFCPYGIAH